MTVKHPAHVVLGMGPLLRIQPVQLSEHQVDLLIGLVDLARHRQRTGQVRATSRNGVRVVQYEGRVEADALDEICSVPSGP